MTRLVALLSVLTLLVGCGTAPARLGVADRVDAQRLQRVYDRVIAPQVAEPLRLRIVASDAFCGYAWPDGRIAVTRGLLRNTTDDELAAALAHEVGHLLVDGHCAGIHTLRGAPRHVSTEADADAAALGLLSRAGVSADALTTLLHKLHDHTCDDELRHAIRQRLAVLED